MRLLVVDDDPSFVRMTSKILIGQNYTIDVATDGQVAWELIQSCTYDLIVLDVMLPKLDGLGLCQKLRQANYSLPVLLLTARNSSNDKVTGLDAGADDYMSKPIDWQEFLARIRALLRREASIGPAILTWGALSLNPGTCEVHYAGQLLALRPREYKLLELFLRNPHRVFNCGAILEQLWSFSDQPSNDVVRAHVKGLRQRLKSATSEEVIETVYGLGYRLKLAEDPVLVPAAPVLDELQQAILEAWAEVESEVLERVAVLEAAACAVQTKTIAPLLKQQAIAEAHKLSGTVGSYGFKLGSQLARQIEGLLQEHFFDAAQEVTLRKQVAALRQELSTAPRMTAAALSDPPLLRSHSVDLARILAIDDDPLILRSLKQVLEPWGMSLTLLSDPHQVWSYLETTAPDLLLLDIEMPQMSGLELCEQIRSHGRWAGLPIVFVTVHTDTETVQKGFIAGADDFVVKPIVAPELINRVITRIERYRLWQRLTEQDALTQLTTRFKFTQSLHQWLQSAEQQRFVLVLLEIDQLASINWQYGYDMGDATLKYAGTLLMQMDQAGSLNARWSGNKFAIALSGITALAAKQLLSNLMAELREPTLVVADGTEIRFTLSTGIAQYPEDGQDIQSLYRVAESDLIKS